MLHLRGGAAFSESRLARLLTRIRSRIPQVSALSANLTHFVDLEGELDARGREILDRLLRYGPREAVREPEGQLLVVVPRLGTISPWSSKATDIARICGLDGIRRLERGIAYHISGVEAGTLPEIVPLVHDRMTETVLSRFEDAEQLFSRTGPLPFTSVDVLGSGHEALENADRQLGRRTPNTVATRSSTRTGSSMESDRSDRSSR
jgi:phosphoribosylformylglycinamidine synthase